MSIFTSILTGGSNNHETTAEEVNALATDLVTEGVVGAITNTSGVAPATGAFAVNEQGTPAMAVDVSAGVAYVEATPTGQGSQMLRVRSTTTEEVTINNNTSGSTRYDWIYLKIDPDNAADPALDASDVATLVVSRSTSSTADDGTPPTYGYPLVVVTVANGETAITNGMISDRRKNAGASPAEAFFRGRKKVISTSTQPTGLTIQFGWDYQVGDNTTNIEKAITFPTPFSSPPIVFVTQMAARSTASGAPDSTDDFTTAFADAAGAYPDDITASGFIASLTGQASFSSSFNFGFSWIAIGPV